MVPVNSFTSANPMPTPWNFRWTNHPPARSDRTQTAGFFRRCRCRCRQRSGKTHFLLFGAKRDSAVLGRELERVEQQVEQDFFQFVPITQNTGEALVNMGFQAICLSAAICLTALARPWINSTTGSGSFLSSNRPDSSRMSSSKSLMSFSRRMPLFCIVCSILRAYCDPVIFSKRLTGIPAAQLTGWSVRFRGCVGEKPASDLSIRASCNCFIQLDFFLSSSLRRRKFPVSGGTMHAAANNHNHGG